MSMVDLNPSDNLEDKPGEAYRYFDIPELRGVTILCQSYKITSQTPKGFWIDIDGWGGQENLRHVQTASRKAYARRTRAEAWEDFKHRKASQVKIIKAQLASAEQALERTQGEQPQTDYDYTEQRKTNDL